MVVVMVVLFGSVDVMMCVLFGVVIVVEGVVCMGKLSLRLKIFIGLLW